MNGITEDFAKPLPVIHEMLKVLYETIVSMLNLQSGYR
jgi:hypothetical protein